MKLPRPVLVLALALAGADAPSVGTPVVPRPPAKPLVYWGTLPLADGFDPPVGPPDGQGYYDAQPFGVHTHLGADYNGVDGADSDLGDPVYTVASGEVSAVEAREAGWGKVVRVVHRYAEPDGRVRVIESLYGHLAAVQVQVGQRLHRGAPIGTIGTGGGAYSAHLHFELRSRPGLPLGFGYGIADGRHLAPVPFIERHRPARG